MPFDPRREVDRLVLAAMLLTRLPLPAVTPEPDWLPRAAKWFPLVGLGVGAASAATLLVAGRIWTGIVPAILAVAVAIALTGAFHEDGLADTADGFGGWTPEARLAIMKDSRLGTYGALALALALALRIAALATMPVAAAAAALVAAGAGARLAGVATMAALPYAGDPESAKVVQGGVPTRAELVLAAVTGLLPLALLPSGAAAVALAAGSATAALAAWRVSRGLGGQTGDVLGAVAVLYETAFLLGAAASVGARA